MSEQPVSELTKVLSVLTERLEDLRQTIETRFEAVEQRLGDLRHDVNQRLGDLRHHFDGRLDDAQKLSTWVLGGLLVAIALLLAKIAFWP
jgi:hypothetical protein